MTCHLIDLSKWEKLTSDDIRNETKVIERICNSDKFDVEIVMCKKCAQLFIYCFKEYNMANGEDDYWTFWVPVEQADIEELKNAQILLKYMGELIHDKSHICWSPTEEIYWREGGNPLAYTIFLPF